MSSSDLESIAGVTRSPLEYLKGQTKAVLENAAHAHRNGLKIYESLRNLSDVIGTEYGDRVLYELIQNAHDAHRPNEPGRIEIKLITDSSDSGVLYIANCGNGFRREDVDAIANLATSAKEIGEGIGNKGLRFRSIEALTKDVHIYSRSSPIGKIDYFDGYCFRFASHDEVYRTLRADGFYDYICKTIAEIVPRYLVPIFLTEQPEEVTRFAKRGYSTVIMLPLRSTRSG